ncbi:MAG TPA: nucleotidyltransferase family protein [Gemmataceae bacterium]|nr:nucleotidyltransferase family protein [Gemmataceae bacterium]
MPRFIPSQRPRATAVTAAILAGGLGTRLRSVVADRPKALAPVAGRPFVAHLLDFLNAAGLARVVLLTGFRGEQVKSALGDRYGRLTLTYSQEPSPLGTGGALRAAFHHFDSEMILLLNGDSYCRVDLRALVAFHRNLQAGLTLSLVHADDASRFGRVIASPNGRIDAFAEKEAGCRPGWINAGVYLLQRSLVEETPTGGPMSLERDLLPKWIEQGVVYGRRAEGPFMDIGTPESYAAADHFLAELAAA